MTAARAGSKVVLVQDRPVLGGNACSEVRLWILGATSHMGNNNRWAREGGVIDELLVENLYRNPEGNPLILDTIILEMVVNEPNITLLLNTAVNDLEKSDADTIQSVHAFCSQNSTDYTITAAVFVDASGDGIVGFLAGAAFRIGAEARSEFGEQFAPDKASQELLGHTIYFYSKVTGQPVKFIPPSFALRDITRIPRWRDIKFNDTGCRLWWLEWGGALDTIHDSEKIKWELWKVAYGVWNHIKNSGLFPEAETLTLEWVGTIPGKRESRRFEGDMMITQADLVEQRRHTDAVSFGGWAIDLHPSDGVFSAQPGCQQWHSKGVYQIPYRAMYSRNVRNLFLAGRIISASHIAFGSTRVMATCAHNGQAVGLAAAICAKNKLQPRDLLAAPRMKELQRELLRMGQYIPGLALEDERDLARTAEISATGELKLSEFTPSGETMTLDASWAMMLPVQPGAMPAVEFLLEVSRPTTLRAELRVSSQPDNHTPDVTLTTYEIQLNSGARIQVPVKFDARIDVPRYAFVCLMANPDVAVHLSDQRVTGVLAVTQKFNRAVAKSPRQEPPPGSGIDSFEFWIPQRRPSGKNLAVKIDPPLEAFGAQNLTNGFDRPTNQPNAWIADFSQEQPVLRLAWDKPQTIARIELCFDTDFDHPMESVLMGHPERVIPFCVREVMVAISAKDPALAGQHQGKDANGSEAKRLVFQISDNHQSRQSIHLQTPVTTDALELRLDRPGGNVPAALFTVRCLAPN
ncbi:MAG: FAD-dependent oxidoreductase [Verrucomicrobiota bacterium]